MDIEDLKERLNRVIDEWGKQNNYGKQAEAEAVEAEVVERKLPEGKRAVRTKSMGDRVYVLDEEKKTRAWVTNPDILKATGFELTDVVEIDDSELLTYQMSQALYRVPES